MTIPEEVYPIAQAIKSAGGHAYLVGGCVRDLWLTKQQPKDFDIEVYGLEVDQVRAVLERLGKVDAVGVSFGVFKLKLGTQDFDISLPRRDSKVSDTAAGRGRGFIALSDPHMSIAEAAARRDFTINSMAYHILDDELFDPFRAHQDYQFGRLAATSDMHFIEDPLRVLRGMQFAGRFNLTMDSATARLCRLMRSQHRDLALERVFEEWWKWAHKSKKPSLGMDVLLQSGWLQCYPTLANMAGCPQEPAWHPEGDAWQHTKHCVDHVDFVMQRETDYDSIVRGVLTLAVLLHDVGKASTTVLRPEDNRIVSPGHAQAGVEPATQFLRQIGCPGGFIDTILPLVACHMDHLGADINSRFVRRLARRLDPANIRLWESVVECDSSGRPPLPKSRPGVYAMVLAESEDITLHKPQAILMGRHVLSRLGIAPGPLVGMITRRAYEAQLDGQFADEAGAVYWMIANQYQLIDPHDAGYKIAGTDKES
jgi:tRNA nucleotidyltransferase (CCA-adding enzyme)